MATKKNIQQDRQQSSTPSLFNVLFYTLFLPLTIVLLYAKNFTPEALASLQRPQSFQAKVSPQSQSQAQNQSQFQGQATQPQTQTRAKVEEMRSRDEPALKSSAKDRPDTGTSTVSSQMSSTRQLYDSMTERPQDTTFIRASDTSRQAVDAKIEVLRTRVDQKSRDIMALVTLANTLANRNISFSETNIDSDEILWCYERAIIELKVLLKSNNDPQNRSNIEDTLCRVYSYYASAYKVADRYDEAEKRFNEASSYECSDEAKKFLLERRGQVLIILGKYVEAARDYKALYEIDAHAFLSEGLKSVDQIMSADSAAFPGGWKACLEIINKHLPIEKANFEAASSDQDRESSARSLQKMHHLLFTFFDKHQDDPSTAWMHLELSQNFKAAYTEAPWQQEFYYFESIKAMFKRETFAALLGTGMDSRIPIFLIGFPRSGTTLLERILDAHPNIGGLGEMSALASKITSLSERMSYDESHIEVLEETGNDVLKEMQLRWEKIVQDRKGSGEEIEHSKENPLRLVDKLNTNHRFVGYIHILFPNALILHCARNPMDAVFSSYKHDFNVERVLGDGTSKNVDSYSTMEGVSKMYQSFREYIDYYDTILPGRLMHVRYEELVDDFEGVARAVIEAAGLEWFNDILDFHNKTQNVNTFSSTQVRQKINKSGIDAWKKYETQLQPLVKLLGKYASYDLTTTNYSRRYL